jgi:hypothetical protein
MDRTQVDQAIDEITYLVDGMASGKPARAQEIKDGLARIIAKKTLLATAEASCDRIGYWRLVADILEEMAGKHEAANVSRPEDLEALRKRASQIRTNAHDLEQAMCDVMIAIARGAK